MDENSAIQVIDLTKFYWAIGALIVTNIGTIGSIAWAGLRATWWLAKLHSQVEENTKDIDAAHIAIRKIAENKG